MDSNQKEPEAILREEIFRFLDNDDIEVSLTKLELLLKDLKKSDEDKEAV